MRGRLLLWDGKAEDAFHIAQKNLGGTVDDVHISPSEQFIAATAGGDVAIFDQHGNVIAQFKSPPRTRSFVFTNDAEIVTAGDGRKTGRRKKRSCCASSTTAVSRACWP